MLQSALAKEGISKMEGQLDKIDFLLESMIKSSRLEIGLIQLNNVPLNLFNTIADAVAGIGVKAEKKNIEIIVDCPQDYILAHDKKWTVEALFNILENAVKYSPHDTKIEIKVVLRKGGR